MLCHVLPSTCGCVYSGSFRCTNDTLHKGFEAGSPFIQNIFEMERTISHSETFFCSRHTQYKGVQQFSDQAKLAEGSIFWQFIPLLCKKCILSNFQKSIGRIQKCCERASFMLCGQKKLMCVVF